MHLPVLGNKLLIMLTIENIVNKTTHILRMIHTLTFMLGPIPSLTFSSFLIQGFSDIRDFFGNKALLYANSSLFQSVI